MRHTNRTTIIAILLLTIFASPSFAQNIDVTASVNSTTIGVQDQLQLTLTVSGREIGDAQPPRNPSFPGFKLASGPNVSTQFQWINGRVSNSKSFTYTLLPEKEGQYTIDPIDVIISGRTYRTEPISIRVTAGGGRVPAQPPVDPFGDVFSDPLERLRRPRSQDGEVFMEAELDRKTAYAGQQVTLSFLLYTQVGVTGIQIQESPPLTGFWVEDLNVDSNPKGRRLVLDGKEYTAYLVKRQALFPNAPGRLKVPPFTFAISARMGGDYFSFFSRPETIYRKTGEIGLEVKPLPAAGRPDGFSNAVGSFSLTSRLDKQEAATGDAVALRVRLSGRGNLKMVPDLQLPKLPGFTVYSSKRTDNLSPSEGGAIGGEKTWEYVLVPRTPGSHTLPPVSFSYFDPERGTYETLSTAPLQLEVSLGAEGGDALGGLSGISKQSLTRVGTDIHFIKLAGDFERADVPPYRSFWFYALAVIPLLVNAGALLYRREERRRSGDPVTARSRKARREALKKLRAAAKAGRSETVKFYDGAAAALSGYLEDRFDLPGISLTADTLERALQEKSVAPETVEEAVACLQECDFGRFVAADAGPGRAARLASRIRKAIDALENAGR